MTLKYIDYEGDLKNLIDDSLELNPQLEVYSKRVQLVEGGG